MIVVTHTIGKDHIYVFFCNRPHTTKDSMRAYPKDDCLHRRPSMMYQGIHDLGCIPTGRSGPGKFDTVALPFTSGSQVPLLRRARIRQRRRQLTRYTRQEATGGTASCQPPPHDWRMPRAIPKLREKQHHTSTSQGIPDPWHEAARLSSRADSTTQRVE